MMPVGFRPPCRATLPTSPAAPPASFFRMHILGNELQEPGKIKRHRQLKQRRLAVSCGAANR